MGKPGAVKLEKDVTHEVGDDAAFLAIIDVSSYSKDLPEWDYASLTKKLAADMSAGRVIAWGCPDGPVAVRLSRGAPSTALVKERHAFLKSTLVVTGPLCLVGYTSITMCAQFGDERFPQSGDLLFTLPVGRYTVTVSRRFAHEEGEQFPEGELPDGELADHHDFWAGMGDEPGPAPSWKALAIVGTGRPTVEAWRVKADGSVDLKNPTRADGDGSVLTVRATPPKPIEAQVVNTKAEHSDLLNDDGVREVIRQFVK
jgi:hypothetical protein